MSQVVTPQNHVEFLTTGKVPEFKAPEPAKVEVKPTDPVVTTEAKAPEIKTEVKAETPPRGDDGKFVKAEGEVKAEAEAKPQQADDDDVKLTRKIEKIIAKKHRAQKEAEEFGAGEARRAMAAEQRAADLQRQIDELQGTKSGPNKGGAKQDGDEPKPEDFKTVGEYTRALVKYEAKLAGEKGRQTVAQSQQQARANEVIGQFVERQEAFKAATPDYEEVLESADFDVPPITQQYLVESELGPQLAYHLAKNPDVVTSLRKLSPARQLAELGKLELKFETKAAPVVAAASTNGISKAPAPIQPLDAKSTPVVKDPKDMSFQELREHRRAEERAKRA